MNLDEFLKIEINKKHKEYISEFEKIVSIVKKLSIAATKISKIISKPESIDLSLHTGSLNNDGDITKKLDIEANSILQEGMKETSIKWFASEEEKKAILINKSGQFCICVDPLDGSSNIETNAPIGTIFGIYNVKSNAKETVLQKGEDLISSGFFVFGPRTMLVLTLGDGVVVFQLNDKNNFILMNGSLKIPKNTYELSLNFSNYQIWPDSIKKYIDNCIDYDKNHSKYNMRWIGSLVADCQRILTRGGIFMYPQDKRKGYESGRLRLVYEANPISFIIEQAGGLAIDGNKRILSLKPKYLHERVPLIFGSENEIKKYINIG